MSFNRNIRLALGACAAVLCAQAQAQAAACIADTPLDTARWMFQHHYWFFQQRTDAAATLLSAQLRQGMETQWKCVASEMNCPLVADPWTNVSDGAVGDPVVFSLRNSPPERSRVGMRFVLGRAGGVSEPATAELVLVRDPQSGCFVLDELVGAAGTSLRNSLSLPAS